MNEVEKMYKNTGVESVGFNPYKLEDEYSPFTAEKQIELIKWLANYGRFCCWKFKPTNEWVIYDNTYMVDGREVANSDFEECLASLIVCIWQDLTEEEKKQMKNILE